MGSCIALRWREREGDLADDDERRAAVPATLGATDETSQPQRHEDEQQAQRDDQRVHGYFIGTAARMAGPAAFAGTGLWRYAAMLPIADPAHRVTLGEGGTPLLDCPRLAAALGVRRLLLKYDGPNPTGTVKDRSSTTAIAAALQFGYRATSVVSSGRSR